MEILILDVLQIANYRKLGMCQFCIFCMMQISDILIFDVKNGDNSIFCMVHNIDILILSSF